MFTYLVGCPALDLLFEVQADSDQECANFAASLLFNEGAPIFHLLNLTLLTIKMVSDFDMLLQAA